MADKRFPTLPGFRDFAPQECAVRNYLFAMWRKVARRYGFVEYEAPLLEPLSLYQKKAGDELNSQLFSFQDQGKRQVALRPELTASLARMVAAHQRNFSKPMKWFEIGSCFRYEAPQAGRGREFIQFNADIIGEDSAGSDAELLALAIDTMLVLGFEPSDFVLRASDRQSWLDFCQQKQIEDVSGLLQIIDKLERDSAEVAQEKLNKFGLQLSEVQAFIADANNASPRFKEILSLLEARGLADCVELDLTIVRGLAYYTGTVFEIFDRKKSLRAVAGGGRYDDLINALSDGAIDLPCTGFAMGDMVIKLFIEKTPHALMQMEAWLKDQSPAEIYVMIADEEKRSDALGVVSALRDKDLRVDYPLSPLKFNKQFKKADEAHARYAVIVGSEFPEVRVKTLGLRTEETLTVTADFAELMQEKLQNADGPLFA